MARKKVSGWPSQRLQIYRCLGCGYQTRGSGILFEFVRWTKKLHPSQRVYGIHRIVDVSCPVCGFDEFVPLSLRGGQVVKARENENNLTMVR